MQNRRLVLFLLLINPFCTIFAQEKGSDNPLLVHSDKPIRFDLINAASIRSSVNSVIVLSDQRINRIIAASGTSKTPFNVLMAADELFYDLLDLSMKLQTVASTYADDSTRNAANEESEKISMYVNNLYLNDGLYKALQSFNAGNINGLKPNHQKFLKELLLAFEKNGMKLKPLERERLKEINKKLISFGTQFDKNIAEFKDSITFTAAQLKGLPANMLTAWKRPQGDYTVYVNSPNYFNVLKYADADATRRIMYLHYNNRAYPANVKPLDSLVFYRQKLAESLGFKTYAEYALADKMAARPENVWKFEDDLTVKLTPYVTKELDELKRLKHTMHPELPDSLYMWDVSYYNNKLLDTRFALNSDEVKQYFEMNNTLKGMFGIYEKLFNLKITEVSDMPLWFPKVKAYEMFVDGKKAGSFYLDLYPRPNKYTHFACFPISQYRIADGKEILPVAALVCNFPEGSAEEPSLLLHSDVETLFHEFGHLVHCLLARSDISTQGLSAIKGDFIEAPSQFLENWVWEYASLKVFAKHYKTGAVLPESLFAKMKRSQNVGKSTSTIRQVYLGLIDFTFEDKYNTIGNRDLVEVSRDVMKIGQLPFAEGTHFIYSFGHLNSYAANYYGYLWSKVFAQDMFSVFLKNGVMNTQTGIRYRKEILEKGASKEEIDMLRAFLGREPSAVPFMESLGLIAR